jgi:transposase
MDQRWSQAPGRRDQLALFALSVEESVPPDHPVRLFEACMDAVDWVPFEARYAGRVGQPPIHPRLMASAILYGLIRNIRSSRMLEDATRERVDFMWLLEGRTIDHSTLAAFRTAFATELKGLNRELCRLVCARFDDALVTLIIDGTRVRANSDRYGARTAQALESLIAACALELDRKLQCLDEEDARAEADAHAVSALESEVATLRAKVAQYERALGVARERDTAKRAKDGANATPVRVPVSDPDAQIVPNKDGGFAPNYTPVAAVDAATGLIVAAEVLTGSDEASAVQPAVDEAAGLCGQRPQRVLADSGFASGENLCALEAMNVEAYMPTTADVREDNPANRDDPTAPVQERDRERLPLRGKRLAPNAFVYDETADCYYCPMGKTLNPVRRNRNDVTGNTHTQYRCPGKHDCPLANRCVKSKANARTLTRDHHQPLREATARRMATPDGRAIYKTRAPLIEGVFATIKHHMNIRRFLLRGLEKVRNEWTWICTAYNLKKIIRLLTPNPKPNPQKTPSKSPNTSLPIPKAHKRLNYAA